MVTSGAKRGHMSPLLSECHQKYPKLLLSVLLQSTISYTRLGIHSFKIFVNKVRRSIKRSLKLYVGSGIKKPLKEKVAILFSMDFFFHFRGHSLRNTMEIEENCMRKSRNK